jgi:hypothetical protein
MLMLNSNASVVLQHSCPAGGHVGAARWVHHAGSPRRVGGGTCHEHGSQHGNEDGLHPTAFCYKLEAKSEANHRFHQGEEQEEASHFSSSFSGD